MPDDTLTPAINGVELCGDAEGALFLHAHCHPTTPLRARTEGDVLILSCAQPTCRRDVARVHLAPEEQ